VAEQMMTSFCMLSKRDFWIKKKVKFKKCATLVFAAYLCHTAMHYWLRWQHFRFPS